MSVYAMSSTTAFPRIRQWLRSPTARNLFLLSPAILILLIFFFIPLINSVWGSFNGAALDFSQFSKAFTDPLYFNVFLKTFEVAFSVTLLCVLIGYPLTYYMTTLSRRGASIFSVFILVPLFTAFIIRTFGWMVILGRGGVLNKFLLSHGLIDAPLKILGTSTAVYIGLIHVLTPIAVFVMFSSMRQIDRSLLSASQVLGATPTQAFLRVYLPMSIPAMVSAGVLVFIMAMGFYITPVLLGGPADTMISQLIVTQVTTMLNLNFGYALSVILLVATLAVIILSNLFVPIEQMWAVQESSGSVAGSRKLPAPLVRALKHFLRLIELFLDALLKRPQWLVSALMAVYVWIVVLFLLLPLIITYILSFSSSPFLVFPPPGFSLQWYEKFFNDPQWRSALWMSVKIASAAATLSVVIGTCAAMGLVRGTFKAKRALFLFLLAPLLVPVIVVALSMYVSMSKIGLLGTFAGLCIGHLVLTVPYAIVIIVAAVKGLDRNLEYAASTLGATNFQTQRRIVLPLLAPALATAWIMSFLSSFDELLVTLFLLGRQEQTLPLKMWSDIRIQIDPVISSASATIVTVVALIVILSQFKSLRSKAAAHDSEGK